MKPIQVSFFRRIALAMGHSAMAILMAYLFFALLALSVLFHLAERHQEAYSTWPRTVVNILVLFMSGYDIDKPETTFGIVCSFLTLLLGICFLGCFTGEVASYLVERRLKGGSGMKPVDCSGHIIVTRWSKDTEHIVEELCSEDVKDQKHIVVIDKALEKLPVEGNPFLHFVHGDPTESVVLERAGVMRADTAIVLADATSTDYNAEDARNILITLAIESMNKAVYTCVQILNPDNRKHVERANADEIICTTEVGTKLVVHSSLSKGLSKLVTDLLSFGEGSEIYRTPLSKRFAGKGYTDLAVELLREHKITLLALVQDGTFHVNPQKEIVVKEGDEAFVLAEDQPVQLTDGK
ncbi:MAG: TrkA family potassium uptake protein [Planctomycetes bacterium]|nr:TrkA family potassium uptake protein [Planctomycetota bacterium]